jgi:hypothetical protein
MEASQVPVSGGQGRGTVGRAPELRPKRCHCLQPFKAHQGILRGVGSGAVWIEASGQPHAPAALPLSNSTPLLLNGRLSGSRLGLDERRGNKSLPFPGIRPRVVQPVAYYTDYVIPLKAKWSLFVPLRFNTKKSHDLPTQ